MRRFLTSLVVLVLGILLSSCGGGQGPEHAPTGVAHEVRTYNAGKLYDSDATFTISGAGSSGIYFTFQLDPQQRYSLTVAGAEVLGEATVRVRQDDVLSYVPAPAASRQWNLHGVTQLEVLIYADTPFIYDVHALHVQSCASCGVDADLKARIIRDVPELPALLEQDRYQAAVRLLDWVANEFVFAFSSEIAAETNVGIDQYTAAELFFNVFEPNNGGGFCGAAAVFYHKVLKLFGFDAFTLNFGELTDDLTHVTVVVYLDGRYYLLDPSFNLQLRQPDGNPVALTAVDWSNFPSDHLFEAGVPQRSFIALAEEAFRCPMLVSDRGDRLICSSPGWGGDAYLALWRDRMVRNGVEPTAGGFWSLLSRRVFGIGDCDAAYCAAFLDEVRARGIPVGMP